MQIRTILMATLLALALPVHADEAATRAASAASSTDAEVPPVFRSPELHNPEPAYPDIVRDAGEKGRVVIRALIGKDGALLDAKMAQSSGFPRLDVLALDAVRTWKFQPGTRDGKPVTTSVNIPFEFGDTPASLFAAQSDAINAAMNADAEANKPAGIECSKAIPKVLNWEPLITPQPPVNEYPKPIKDRAVQVNKWDPIFDFDSGSSPYLAYELPRWEGEYTIQIISSIQHTLFYPVLMFLDKKMQPTRCVTKAMREFVPGDWQNYPQLRGEVAIDFDNRRDHYVIIYTTIEQAISVTDPRSTYDLAQLTLDWVTSLWRKEHVKMPDIQHGYEGYLQIKLKKPPVRGAVKPAVE